MAEPVVFLNCRQSLSRGYKATAHTTVTVGTVTAISDLLLLPSHFYHFRSSMLLPTFQKESIRNTLWHSFSGIKENDNEVKSSSFPTPPTCLQRAKWMSWGSKTLLYQASTGFVCNGPGQAKSRICILITSQTGPSVSRVGGGGWAMPSVSRVGVGWAVEFWPVQTSTLYSWCTTNAPQKCTMSNVSMPAL